MKRQFSAFSMVLGLVLLLGACSKGESPSGDTTPGSTPGGTMEKPSGTSVPDSSSTPGGAGDLSTPGGTKGSSTPGGAGDLSTPDGTKGSSSSGGTEKSSTKGSDSSSSGTSDGMKSTGKKKGSSMSGTSEKSQAPGNSDSTSSTTKTKN